MIHTCTPFLCCLFFLFPLFYVYLSLEHFTGKVVRLLLPSKQPAHTHTRSHTTHIISYHFPTTQTTRAGAKEREKTQKKNVLHPWLKFMIFNVFNLYMVVGRCLVTETFIKVALFVCTIIFTAPHHTETETINFDC